MKKVYHECIRLDDLEKRPGITVEAYQPEQDEYGLPCLISIYVEHYYGDESASRRWQMLPLCFGGASLIRKAIETIDLEVSAYRECFEDYTKGR